MDGQWRLHDEYYITVDEGLSGHNNNKNDPGFRSQNLP